MCHLFPWGGKQETGGPGLRGGPGPVMFRRLHCKSVSPSLSAILMWYTNESVHQELGPSLKSSVSLLIQRKVPVLTPQAWGKEWLVSPNFGSLCCATEINLQLAASYEYTDTYMCTHSHVQYSPEPRVDGGYIPSVKRPRLTVYTA